MGLQITCPLQGGFVPSAAFIALVLLSLYICSLPLSPHQSLLLTPFYIFPGPRPKSAFSGDQLPLAPPIQASHAFCPTRTPNFSGSWTSRPSSALSWAGSVGGIGWGRSVLGCPLGEGGLPESSLQRPWGQDYGMNVYIQMCVCCEYIRYFWISTWINHMFWSKQPDCVVFRLGTLLEALIPRLERKHTSLKTLCIAMVFVSTAVLFCCLINCSTF